MMGLEIASDSIPHKCSDCGDKFLFLHRCKKQKYTNYATVVEKARWQKDMEGAGVEFF